MTLNEARAKARNPGAFFPGERWLVVNEITGEPIQSDRTRERAQENADTLNRHEVRCGRREVYGVEAVTSEVQS
jgi:hypothetical protein